MSESFVLVLDDVALCAVEHPLHSVQNLGEVLLLDRIKFHCQMTIQPSLQCPADARRSSRLTDGQRARHPHLRSEPTEERYETIEHGDVVAWNILHPSLEHNPKRRRMPAD